MESRSWSLELSRPRVWIGDRITCCRSPALFVAQYAVDLAQDRGHWLWRGLNCGPMGRHVCAPHAVVRSGHRHGRLDFLYALRRIRVLIGENRKPAAKCAVVVIICGVSGAGKTVTGQLLAQELGWAFYDADDFHPQANIDKMRGGVQLTDEDRWPWLESLRELIKRCVAAGENAVLACSALKRAYRRYLRANAEVKLVFLRGEYALIVEQLQHRRGHFMNPALLQSQFADLEEPKATEGAIVIELGRGPHKLVQEIKRKLPIRR